MINPLSSIVKILLPFVVIYLAFNMLGPVAGIIAVLVVILAAIYLNRASIYQNMAGRKYHNGDYEGALRDMKTAVSFDPKAAKVRGTYAFLLLKTGYIEEASKQIDEALELAQPESDKNSLRTTKALVLWKQGKLDEAIKELSDLLEVFETTNVYASLGFMLIAKGDLDKALEFNLKARDYNSTNPIILDNLGTTYYLLGDYDKAFETYQEVMKLKPGFPEAFYNYARVLEKKGVLEKALYMVRHALTLKFWSTSTVSREEVEACLRALEEKEKSVESQANVTDNISEGTTD